MHKKITSYLPIAILATILISFFALGGAKYMDPENFGAQLSRIMAWVKGHLFLSALILYAIYAICCAIAIPSVVWLTLSGGILFGGILGGFICALGSTTGAIILYWASSQAMGGAIKPKDGSLIARFENSFLKHEFTNLLALRLLPISPFFAVTIAASAFGVNFRKFVLATFIGILPVEIALAFLGKAFKDELLAGRLPSAHDLLSPSFTLPLIGLALLALSPNLVEFFKPKPKN